MVCTTLFGSYELIIGVSSNCLIYIVWRAIRLLQIAGLQVVCVVADGASANRRFFSLHSINEYKKSGVIYLAPNVCHASGDKVYFVADPPHLLKTIRNAWYNSQSKKTHHLIVCCDYCTVMVCYYASCRTMGKE